MHRTGFIQTALTGDTQVFMLAHFIASSGSCAAAFAGAPARAATMDVNAKLDMSLDDIAGSEPKKRQQRDGAGFRGGPGGASGACYTCGQTGHLSRDCPKRGGGGGGGGGDSRPPDGYVCKICNVPGHFIAVRRPSGTVAARRCCEWGWWR